MATNALKSTPVHDTLRKVVVLFRLIALLWMGALVTATLLSDSGASVAWVLAAVSVAVVGAGGTILMARARRLDAWWWLLIDGAATAFIVMAPGLAGARDLFYGGMGLSWLLVVVWAYPSAVHWALAIVSLVGAQLAGSELGIRRISATGFVGDIAVWTVSGIVYGWAFWIVRSTDLRRQEAESRLAEEIRQRSVVEARAAIAADIHDSVLQSLSYVQAHSTDRDVVGIAAQQDKELRRYLGRISAEYLDGLEVLLREAAWEVEDRYAVRVEVVCVRDSKRDDAIDDLVAAAREALVNAARHSHDSTISVFAEVRSEAVAVFVKDDGVGFELSNTSGDHRGIERSIVGRMERHGGSARITTAPGLGTEVELTLPRVRS
jgi:signal transduction histidine kinase